MSLRDDVRWVCDAADGFLIGALPGRLPKWETKEGEKLGWLVLLLWRKFYDASMKRITLEAEVERLKGDVDGLRETNERLTDLLDERRERVVATNALAAMPLGFYWVADEAGIPIVGYWDGKHWQYVGSGTRYKSVPPVLSVRLVPPAGTEP